MIRTANEYRQTKENNKSILMTITGNKVIVMNTQIPYLKKHKWYNHENTVATLINDNLVTIENYLKTLPKSHYLQNTDLDNRNLSIKKIENIKGYKPVYDKKLDRYYVIYFIGNIKKKRSFSCKKYGSENAKRKAENYINIRKSM